jgi:glycosyltransferase involved in cell wall biosynthesis
MPDPFFSIIIPTYNRLSTLPNSVDSVLDQTYQNFEVIIVDDGSEDGTVEWVKAIIDNRIKYFKQQNSGVCVARNKGAAVASGDWICFLDSDDTVTPNWLADFANLINLGKYDLLFCGMELEDTVLKINQVILPSKDVANGKEWWRMNAGIFTVKSELIRKVGCYDTNLKFGENTELGFRLKDESPRIGFIDHPNLKYKVSTNGGSRNLKHIAESNLHVLQKHKERFKKEKKAAQLLAQVSGVAFIRLEKFKEGRYWLWKGWSLNPLRINAFIRAVIGSFPFIARYIWKPDLWK